MSHRFPRLDEVFHQALTRQPSERTAFLAEACSGDAEFQAEIEALLAHAASGDGFLESPRTPPADSLTGRQLGTYRIEALIGSGGMGDVYRARDVRLDRAVALKLLPPEIVTRQSSLARFEQEARAASALNHPNIVTIHEIGHAEGLHFIVQELVEGETLRQRLGRGPLPFSELIGIAGQLATGLAAAEAAGVIHRDIKPENVMLRADGYVKILDFGLAKLTGLEETGRRASGGNVNTASGLVLGTIRYMSPEQARGELVDRRSDIFSLGAVLYEMATGAPAFQGRSPADELSAVLTQDPLPIDRVVSGVPSAFARLVSKALQKQPDERYQTASALLDDLRAIDPGRPAPGRRWLPRLTAPSVWRSVAAIAGVLAALVAGARFLVDRTPTLTEADAILLTDFSNTTGEAAFDGRALRRGLEIQLRQTPFLRIVDEESVRAALRLMARAADDPVTRDVGREICLRQGVKALVAGDIARLGDGYVVTLEAVGAESGSTLAIEQAEAASLGNVLAALGRASVGLRKKLGESLSTLERFAAPIEQATTSSLEALKAYSAGVELMNAEQGRAAAPFLVRATELDPQFVAAYDLGAWALVLSGDSAGAARFAEEANRLKDRATERERISAETTFHHFATGNLVEENRLCTVWKSLYPNEWIPSACLALNYLYPMARFEDAAAEAREILRKSPEVAQGYRFLAPALMHLNRFEEAARVVADARMRDLDNVFLRTVAFQLAFISGDASATAQELEAIRRHEGEGAAVRWQAREAAFEGRWREAEALYRRSGLTGDAVRYAALVGRCDPASAPLRGLLNPERIGRGRVQLFPAFGFDGSFCGDAALALRFAEEMSARAPQATVTQKLSLPLLRASLALARGEPDAALTALRASSPLEDAVPEQAFLRGQAHLRLRQSAEALAAFRAITDRRGKAPTSIFYPLAHVGLGRAAAQAGDRAASRQAYETFLRLWSRADQDLPILVAARLEYARLGR